MDVARNRGKATKIGVRQRNPKLTTRRSRSRKSRSVQEAVVEELDH
jgi:hypothetical protein